METTREQPRQRAKPTTVYRTLRRSPPALLVALYAAASTACLDIGDLTPPPLPRDSTPATVDATSAIDQGFAADASMPPSVDASAAPPDSRTPLPDATVAEAALPDLGGLTADSGPPPPECASGEARPCYPADPATRDVGLCTAGTETCVNGSWSGCQDATLPTTEVCDGADNDCNGFDDDSSGTPLCDATSRCAGSEGCVSATDWTSATLFVTSGSYAANFGGLAGADAICATLAEAADSGGVWIAILSTSSVSARDRFTVSGPIHDTRGTKLANDAADLWDGEIITPIAYDEQGNAALGIVWTATDADGNTDRGPYTTHCGDWTATSGGVEAGRTDSANHRWISIYDRSDQSAHACRNESRLYCIGRADDAP